MLVNHFPPFYDWLLPNSVSLTFTVIYPWATFYSTLKEATSPSWGDIMKVMKFVTAPGDQWYFLVPSVEWLHPYGINIQKLWLLKIPAEHTWYHSSYSPRFCFCLSLTFSHMCYNMWDNSCTHVINYVFWNEHGKYERFMKTVFSKQFITERKDLWVQA